MPGTFGRLAVGLIVFINVIAYNETGAITVLFSIGIAALCATFSGKTKKLISISSVGEILKFIFQLVIAWECWKVCESTMN